MCRLTNYSAIPPLPHLPEEVGLLKNAAIKGTGRDLLSPLLFFSNAEGTTVAPCVGEGWTRSLRAAFAALNHAWRLAERPARHLTRSSARTGLVMRMSAGAAQQVGSA